MLNHGELYDGNFEFSSIVLFRKSNKPLNSFDEVEQTSPWKKNEDMFNRTNKSPGKGKTLLYASTLFDSFHLISKQ